MKRRPGDDGEPAAPRAEAGSAWRPLALRAFRILWLAQLVSNIGSWMQTVGAQWLISRDSGSAGLVALVQTAISLPVLLLGIPSGVLADIVDRRRLLLAAQALMFVVTGALAILTALGRVTSYGVLMLTFLLGCGTALMGPAWQAVQPELVPRDQIRNAATLGGVNVNLARAVGPALGGLVVALAGAAATFALNALSFLVTMAALAAWRRTATRDPMGAESVLPALWAGYRYVRHGPRIRRVLGRSLLFVPAASALWALLPVAARQRLGLGADGYGLLLGAIGVGAVLGAALLPRVRGRWSSNGALAGGGVLFALTMAVLAVVRVPWLAMAILVLSGVAWVGVLSTFNSQMQVTAPDWVRSRALAVYLTIFQGGMAIGSAVWGAIAEGLGVAGALAVAAGALAAGSLIGSRFAVPDSLLDRSPSMHWSAPVMVLEPAAREGPVLVTVEYHVPPERADAFVEAMAAVGRSRLRTGALRWNLFQDGARPEVYLEMFMLASWDEHLRQHGGRLTGADRIVEQEARSLVDRPFRISHYLPARVRDRD
ncbi:MFS transporter [Microtetraspora niveoalba]|uniref:MFS transporter n=1 Tax=Microtetraspora niveoalba TaxID=46175 RepID=UPI00083290EF|nr:MFS transporter [Microtetraspora niveoalba]